MAKDAKGHGSEGRGGLTPVQSENAPFKSRLGAAAGHSFLDPHDPRAYPGKSFDSQFADAAVARGHANEFAGMVGNRQAAAALAQGGPKSGAVPIHGGAIGRSDEFAARVRSS